MWWGSASVKRLRNMMEAIRSRDFTLHYSLEHLRGDERLLAGEINKVITEFRETQARQEAMYGQFESLLNLVNVALIVDDGTGRVLWMNQRAVQDLCGFRIDRLEMLAALHQGLPAALEELKPGEQRLFHLPVKSDASPSALWGGGGGGALSLSMKHYYRQGDLLRLFSIANLQGVLQQNEVEAQRRLVSVLTHEIMNSLAPIISLSETLMDMATGDEQQALAAIHRRSQGLLAFVENYRQLSRIPAPQKSPVRIGDLIADLHSLLTSPYIVYEIEDEGEVLDIDRQQIEQVLINLLKNAEEACACDSASSRASMVCTQDTASTAYAQGATLSVPSITLATHAHRPKCQYLITVTDNGTGILPDVLDRIFVPFFTTKQGGSGIGLSICRQIVINHGGTISVASQPGHTMFTVTLPLA